MTWYDPTSWGDESGSAIEQRNNLNNQGGMASWFADQGQNGYGQLGGELGQSRDYLRRVAMGQEPSIAREQLRQGFQQQAATQRSMAAGAAPQNAAMAARNAMLNTGRAQQAMSGQAAQAGIAERQAAQQALAQMLLQQRQQEMQVALGSRQNAISAFGGVTADKSAIEKYGPAVTGAISAGASAFSDERLKEDVRDGDEDANKAIAGLKAYVYKYKDQKHGKGPRVGIMAQDLEKAGLGHAVMEAPEGKAVHGAHLATANTAMIAALGRRLSKIEGKAK